MNEDNLVEDMRQYVDDQLRAKRDPETITKLVGAYIALKGGED